MTVILAKPRGRVQQKYMENKKALIIGHLGQDGSYMKELLELKGYVVYGCSRHDNAFDMIKNIVPNEVYNFASSSNVFNPWKDLDSIFELDGRFPQKLLECILETDKSIKYFQASSCLVFGRNGEKIQNENSSRVPIHPYGISKLYADNMVNEFRSVHNIFACSGIFFNHESPRRGRNFFTKKMCSAAVRKVKISVGNLDAERDMGYAPDFMEAVYLMMQNKTPVDYIIGTGTRIDMRSLAHLFFKECGLHFPDYLIEEESQKRPNDANFLTADISRINKELGWLPKHTIFDVVKIMINHEKKIKNA